MLSAAAASVPRPRVSGSARTQMQGQQIQRSNAPGRGDVPVRYNPPQGQVMMRQMTRDDFKGPVPVMIGPEELAAIERAHWENERQLKMGERQTEQATRSGKMVVVGMCCVAGFEIAQMCVVIVFLLEHEDFCNQYWENTVDGVYTSPFDGDKFWPVLNGQVRGCHFSICRACTHIQR